MAPVSDEEQERDLNQRNQHERQEPRENVECTICGNHEFVWVVRNGERFTRECICKNKRNSLRNIRLSGLAEQLQHCTFENFQTPNPWQKVMKEMAQKFVQDENRKWLLFSGQSGCGKTHLCTAIAGNFLKAGKSVRYIRWTEDSVSLKACANDDEEYERRMRPLKQCQVLYIDDFLKTGNERDSKTGQVHWKFPSAADIRLAYDLLDYRYCNRSLITILSSERSDAELLDIDAAVGSRIYEMTKGYRAQIIGKEKNWRVFAQ